jgi:hypothetical protein
MTYLTKLLLFLILNLVVMIYTIVRTRQSNLQSDTKTLLYVMSVITPFIGLILFYIKNRTKKNYSIQ